MAHKRRDELPEVDEVEVADEDPEVIDDDHARANAAALAVRGDVATDGTTPGAHLEYKVVKHFDGDRRLDAYVVARVQEVSRAEVQRWIANGWMTLNGGKAKASHRVRQGDHIVVDLPEELDRKPEAQEIPLDIVYEDEFIVVLNKQANLIVHPGRGKENWSGTLTNALQFHFEKLSSAGGLMRPGIVHRLDRDTTGVIVVAKDDYAHKAVALQFEHRQVTKEYLAICYGVIERDRDVVEQPIGPHPSVREKMAIRADPAIGRPASTFYEVLERFEGFTYVRCRPHTGRTHQIRVHLTHISAPIVADKPYAGRAALRLSDLLPDCRPEDDVVLIERQALHAHRLKFRHPRIHEEMDVIVPLPADMQRTLEALRQHRPLKQITGRK